MDRALAEKIIADANQMVELSSNLSELFESIESEELRLDFRRGVTDILCALERYILHPIVSEYPDLEKWPT